MTKKLTLKQLYGYSIMNWKLFLKNLELLNFNRECSFCRDSNDECESCRINSEICNFDLETGPIWKALQNTQNHPFDVRVIKQFESIYKRVINANKRAKKPIYSQNTKNIVRRYQLQIIEYLQKELCEK